MQFVAWVLCHVAQAPAAALAPAPVGALALASGLGLAVAPALTLPSREITTGSKGGMVSGGIPGKSFRYWGAVESMGKGLSLGS